MKPTLTYLGFALLVFVYSDCEKSNKTDFENYFKVAEKKIFISSGAMVKLSDNTFLKDMKAFLFASDGISFETKSENTGNGNPKRITPILRDIKSGCKESE